jgi:hypothetical protein
MHTYPALRNLPRAIFFAANSKSADSSTTDGLLPPNSNIHGTKFLAADAATSLPFSVLPVKQILSNLVEVSAFATSTYPSIHT